MINARLRAVGVPEVEIEWVLGEDGQPTNEAANQFIHTQQVWKIVLKADALDDVGGGAALVYHEARHAEQQFQICRMRAADLGAMSEADKATSIAIRLDVPLAVAQEAAASPLTPGTTEYTIARNWHDPEPGRSHGGTSAEAKAMVDGIEEYLRGQRTRQSLDPLYQDYVRAYESGYRDIPTEWDAFFVSEKVGDKLGVERDTMPPLDDLIAQVAKAKGLPVPGSPAR
jgi:hypothetical protein